MGTLTLADWRQLTCAHVKTFIKATKAEVLLADLAGFACVWPQGQTGSWQRMHCTARDLPRIPTWVPTVLSCAMVFLDVL